MRRPGAEAGREASGTVLALAAIVGVLALPLSEVAAETDGEAAAGTATITGPAEVVDGDGLKIGPVAIRIHGIDAPEAAQDCPKAGGGSGLAARRQPPSSTIWRADGRSSALPAIGTVTGASSPPAR